MEEPEVLQDTGVEPVMDAEPEDSSPSQQEGQEPIEPTEPKKDKIQSRIDELVSQREEIKRDREYWREQAMRQVPQVQPEPVKVETYPDLIEPRSEDFETYDAFVDARADYRAEVKLRKYLAKQQGDSETQAKAAWNDQGFSKYEDWREVFHDNVPISKSMGQVLMKSKAGHDLAYYLGKNPEEARRIFSMPPELQPYEMGKIEAKITPPPQKSKTNAPNPTSPVGGKEVPSKKPDDMSYEEYKQWRSSGGGK